MFFISIYGLQQVAAPSVIGVVVVAAIPVGYVAYQAYTSDYLGFYTLYWNETGLSGPALKYITEALASRMCGIVPLRGQEFNKISQRIRTYAIVESAEGHYAWRLIGLINSRGVSVFCSYLGFLVPPTFFIWKVFNQIVRGLPHLAVFNLIQEALLNLILFYLLVALLMHVLYSSIPKIRRQLELIQWIILIRDKERIDELINTVVTELECQVRKTDDLGEYLGF